MPIRRWAVRPDREMLLHDGTILPVVSREALVDGVLDAVSMMDRAGGGFTVFGSRHPTGVEHEMVTTAAMVEWRDRTDARPQPERPYEDSRPAPTDEDLEVVADALAARMDDDEPQDGLDIEALPEEDLSEIPESVR